MATPADVTLVEGAIHNPNEPRHFMQVTAASGRCVATVAGQVIADSSDAVIVKEVGHNIYDAVIYFPRADVAMSTLQPIDKTTHCPLKGDTAYFDIVTSAGSTHAAAAWSYVKMVAGDELRDMIAFDSAQVELARS